MLSLLSLGVYGKAPGQLIRIAMAIHILDIATQKLTGILPMEENFREIGLTRMKKSVKIMQYLVDSKLALMPNLAENEFGDGLPLPQTPSK